MPKQIFSWAGTARSAKLLFGQPTKQEHDKAMQEMAVWEANETLKTKPLIKIEVSDEKTGEIIGKRETRLLDVAEQILGDVPKWCERYEHYNDMLDEELVDGEDAQIDRQLDK